MTPARKPAGAAPQLRLSLTATLAAKKRFLESLGDDPRSCLAALSKDPRTATKRLRAAGIVATERGATLRPVAPFPTKAQVKRASTLLRKEARIEAGLEKGRVDPDDYGFLYLVLNSDPVKLRISLGYAMPFVPEGDGED
jgi:hypothetical protein